MAEAADTTTLVIGASGIIGRSHVNALGAIPGAQSIAASRRPEADLPANAVPFAVDVTDDWPADCSALAPVTHMVYCAFVDAPSWDAQRAPNTKLFERSLDLVEAHCPALRHVTLLQGTKAYGSHLGAFKTPARETDPRIPEGYFYFDQQDALADRSAARGWAWTALRPHVVIGPALRSPMNLIVVIGVYANLLKAEGKPLIFPGPEAAFDVLYQATDVDLLSQAIHWSGTGNQDPASVYNITNGDFFRWRHVWPRIAEALGMEAAEPEPQKLTDTMNGTASLWREIAQANQLIQPDLGALVSWPFADYVFNTTWDIMSDSMKIRRAGFHEFVDSEQMLVDRLAELQRLKIIPA